MLGVRVALDLTILWYVAQFKFALRCLASSSLIAFVGTFRLKGEFFLLLRLQVLGAKEAKVVLAAARLKHVREVAKTNRAIELEFVAFVSVFGLVVAEFDVRLTKGRF